MTTLDTRSPSGASTRAPVSALREVGIYLGLIALLVTASTTVAVAEGVDVRRIEDATALGQAAMYLQAMFPLVAAVVARFATGGSLRHAGWGFRRTRWRNVGLAWTYGLAVALAGGVLVWATGAGGFDAEGAGVGVAAGLTVLVAPYVILALGEDVGWRGLLVTRLAELYSPRVVVLGSGVIWSAFHWPLILLLGGTPEGVSVWFAVVMFTIGITSLGAVLASMQMRWGIWPGVVAHAVVNATLYHVIEPLTCDREHTGWFGTETGLFAAFVGLLAAVLWLRRRPVLSGPGSGTGIPEG